MANMSPITLGLLAMLAYRTYQGKGRLADMLGKGQSAPAGGTMSDNRAPGAPVAAWAAAAASVACSADC